MRLYICESGRTYQDSDLPPAEVERDRSAELGRCAGEEHLLHVAWDLVEDHGRREGVAVHHPYPQVRMLAHEQRATPIECFILLKPHTHTHTKTAFWLCY